MLKLLSSKRLFTRGIASLLTPAPLFKTMAVDLNGQFKEVKFPDDYKGSWLHLMFYPLDFTFACPTELISVSDRIKDFNDLKCEVLGVSTDSKFSHLAWRNTPRKDGGVGKLNFPMAEDLTKNIASSYGVLLPAGHTFRASFIIDPKGIVRHMTLNEPAVGRNVEEILRVIEAAQHVDQYGEVCQANWKKGMKGINVKKAKDFFEKEYK